MGIFQKLVLGKLFKISGSVDNRQRSIKVVFDAFTGKK